MNLATGRFGISIPEALNAPAQLVPITGEDGTVGKILVRLPDRITAPPERDDM